MGASKGTGRMSVGVVCEGGRLVAIRLSFCRRTT